MTIPYKKYNVQEKYAWNRGRYDSEEETKDYCDTYEEAVERARQLVLDDQDVAIVAEAKLVVRNKRAERVESDIIEEVV